MPFARKKCRYFKGRVASTANHRPVSGSRGRPRPHEGLYKSVTRRVETRRVNHTRGRPDKLDILVEYRQVVNICGRQMDSHTRE